MVEWKVLAVEVPGKALKRLNGEEIHEQMTRKELKILIGLLSLSMLIKMSF